MAHQLPPSKGKLSRFREAVTLLMVLNEAMNASSWHSSWLSAGRALLHVLLLINILRNSTLIKLYILQRPITTHFRALMSHFRSSHGLHTNITDCTGSRKVKGRVVSEVTTILIQNFMEIQVI